jgi:hypothetical protein
MVIRSTEYAAGCITRAEANRFCSVDWQHAPHEDPHFVAHRRNKAQVQPKLRLIGIEKRLDGRESIKLNPTGYRRRKRLCFASNNKGQLAAKPSFDQKKYDDFELPQFGRMQVLPFLPERIVRNTVLQKVSDFPGAL